MDRERRAALDFSSLHRYTVDAVDHPVLAPYSWLVAHLVLPHLTFFAWATLAVESCLGVFLLLGLATRFWALVGVAQSVVITLSVLNAPQRVGVVLLPDGPGPPRAVRCRSRTVLRSRRRAPATLAHLRRIVLRAAAEGVVTRSPLDRAAFALGVGGVLSDLFSLTTSSNNNFVLVQGLALVAFPVLGAVGIAGGLSGRRTLVVVAGAGDVVAALIQLLQFGRPTNWLGGNGSTFVLFAAWGIGLLVVGCTARPDPPTDDNPAK